MFLCCEWHIAQVRDNYMFLWKEHTRTQTDLQLIVAVQ